jgi:hypothetical protein
MNEPKDRDSIDPHPTSQHRTPREIEADESGPIGHPPADSDVKHVFEGKASSAGKAQHRKKGKGKAKPER